METHVTRKLGVTFDPEKVCPYTGLALYQVPLVNEPAKACLVQYWRADGYMSRCRLMTPGEVDHLRAHWQAYKAARAQLSAWLAGIGKA